jgi:osmotically-inducible protein OsmY
LRRETSLDEDHMDGVGRMTDSAATRVETRARTALAASPIYVLRELQVQEENGCLLLSGRVDTFYHKQLAQEVVRAVADGVQVVNAIDVD